MRLLLVDLLVLRNDCRRGALRIEPNLLGRASSNDAVDERFDDLLTDPNVADHDAVARAAILFTNDHVLSDVDQTPREVARVGRAQRRVGETFARAVRRDEVLENGEAFFE